MKDINQALNHKTLTTPQFYMDIINAVPNIIYWIDSDCRLLGCNIHFVRLLNLKNTNDFLGTPYTHMETHLPWTTEYIKSLRLRDMAVLFSGVSEYDVEESPIFRDGSHVISTYLCSRVPLCDEHQQVIGLVVVLTDVTSHTVPKKQQPMPKIAPQESQPQFIHSSEPTRVLIVEDNLVAQQIEQALLVSLNCEVDVAESGELAAQLFVPGKYDLVFMDINLTDTSGYVVSKTFRNLEKNSDHHVPIIALTSHQAHIVQADCRDYFMDYVITKPLTQDQAMRLIQQYVYQKPVLPG